MLILLLVLIKIDMWTSGALKNKVGHQNLIITRKNIKYISLTSCRRFLW